MLLLDHGRPEPLITSDSWCRRILVLNYQLVQVLLKPLVTSLFSTLKDHSKNP